VPASISTVDSATRASAVGHPNSLNQTPTPIPAGSAIASARQATARVPIIGSKKPPLSDSEKPAAGEVTSSSRRR
jgi:hypothetical protein